jgi:prepilin-type N-terminal cleavage/methylation domain-containing protein
MPPATDQPSTLSGCAADSPRKRGDGMPPATDQPSTLIGCAADSPRKRGDVMPPATDQPSTLSGCAADSPRKRGEGVPYGANGFTLLEVIIAVAILSMSLTSLLSSQLAGLKATRYARGAAVAAFLAEHQLYEIEWQLETREGWGDADKHFEGDFSEEGWPDIRYECLVDMIELPEYSELQRAVHAGDSSGPKDQVRDVGEQAFDMLGMVWPLLQGVIEQSIRKSSCTVFWTDGRQEHDFKVETYWTDMSKLASLPGVGGAPPGGSGDPGGGGTPGGAPGGSGRGGQGTPGGGMGGPVSPPGGRR